jgi:hypothetical protein
MLRIRVVQYMYGNFEYFSWSKKINQHYCQRYGYDYVVVNETPRQDRHITWHKIPVIFNQLCDCDYLLFVDADAIFYSHELKIEEELIPLMEDKNILMAQDCTCEHERWHTGIPNSGVILFCVKPIVRAFVKYWDISSDIDTSTRWNLPPEQLALWNVVLPRFPDLVKVLADYYCLHGRYGQYIRHFSRLSDEERTRCIKDVCVLKSIT